MGRAHQKPARNPHPDRSPPVPRPNGRFYIFGACGQQHLRIGVPVHHRFGRQLKRSTPPSASACIFTGIVTDTGSFRHATNSTIFRIAADLIDRGVDDTAVQDRIFNSQKEKNLRLLGHCLANRMEYLPEFRTALIWLSRKDYEDFEIQRGDTEGIVNYLLTIRDVRLAALYPQPADHRQTQPPLQGRPRRAGNLPDAFQWRRPQKCRRRLFARQPEGTIQKFKDLLPLYKDALLKNN
jgi:phosphoesterase RecJ-like protein